MVDLFSWCQWIEQTSIATTLRDSVWLFPSVETVHLFGIIAVVGSTAILDLRLMGVAYRRQSVPNLAARTLSWALSGFAVMLITGSLMFASEATRCYANGPFRIKMLLIVLAGLNALAFHFTAYRRVGVWGNGAATPWGAKFAGAASILLWFAIVVAGRWIAFT